MVSPALKPAVLPASKTSATTFGPESYIVRQPKSGLSGQRVRFTPYQVYIAKVRPSASTKRSEYIGIIGRDLTAFTSVDGRHVGARRGRSVHRLSAGEQRYEDGGGSHCDQHVREDITVKSIERLRVGKRNVSHHDPGNKEITSFAVHHTLEYLALRTDEAGNAGGGGAGDGNSVFHGSKDVHSQRLIGTRGVTEEALVGNADHEVGAVPNKSAERVRECVFPADRCTEPCLPNLKERVVGAGREAGLQRRDPAGQLNRSAQRHVFVERGQADLVVLPLSPPRWGDEELAVRIG